MSLESICQIELLKRFIKIVKKLMKFGRTSLTRRKGKKNLQEFMGISK